MPNILGTQSQLTGIPTLLISGLSQVPDPTTQTALYQVQNWANSFFPWNYTGVTGAYTTGGFAFTYPKAFPTNLLSIVITPVATSNASQAQIVTATTTGFTVKLYDPTGTEIANGDPISFFYLAIGN